MDKPFKKFFTGDGALILTVMLFMLPTIVHNSYSFYVNEASAIPYLIRLGMSILTSLGLSMMIVIVTIKGNEPLGFVFACIETFLNILYYGSTGDGFVWPSTILYYVLASINPICIFVLAVFFKGKKEEPIDRVLKEIEEKQEQPRLRRTNEEIKLNIPHDKLIDYREGRWKP